MIRLLVLILVALNLLLVAWVYWGKPDHPALTAVAHGKAESAAPAPPPPCSTIGPFAEQELVAQLQEKLRASGLGTTAREASETVQDGWWVHVDNVDSEQQTQALNTLHRAGVNDAAAMPDDPQFSVSAGIFSVEDRAQDRAAQVRKLKLDTVVSEHFRKQAAIWLDAPGIAQEALRDGRLTTAGLALEKLRIEACPTATPATNAPPAADIIPAP